MLWRVTFRFAPIKVSADEVTKEPSESNPGRASGRSGFQDKNRLVSKEQLARPGLGINLYSTRCDEVHMGCRLVAYDEDRRPRLETGTGSESSVQRTRSIGTEALAELLGALLLINLGKTLWVKLETTPDIPMVTNWLEAI